MAHEAGSQDDTIQSYMDQEPLAKYPFPDRGTRRRERSAQGRPGVTGQIVHRDDVNILGINTSKSSQKVSKAAVLDLSPRLTVQFAVAVAVSYVPSHNNSTGPESVRDAPLYSSPSFVALCVLPVAGLAAKGELTSVVSQLTLQYDWKGNDFFDAFGFDTFDDPTHGEVNYVDKGTAQSEKLAYVDGDTFYMKADANSTVTGGARGRDSVRISSTESFSDVILILDLVHMPEGCSTWPAFWTVGPDWPNGGEVDIIEGVNSAGTNLVSLHTGQGCSMPSSGRSMTGTASGTSCYTDYGSGNEGCSVTTSGSGNFGPSFNSAGGGCGIRYVYQRSSTDGLNVWFFPASGQVPDDVEGACDTVDPTEWGTPMASFPVSQCDLSTEMQAHQIVFDLTFCGDWAGSSFSGSCSSKANGLSCADYVKQTPSGFTEAFWEINALRVYE